MAAIVATPGTIGGKPRIDGHRIGVNHIAIWHEQMGMDIDEIMAEFDLTRDEVQSALDYYAAHRSEIDMIIAEEERIVAQIRSGV